MGLGKVLAMKLGLEPETRAGKIEWPMNETAIAEMHRHNAVFSPLLQEAKLLHAKLKAIEAALDVEQQTWRANMVAAHPEMGKHSFSVNDDRMTMRVDYREGDKLLPGDSYADESGPDLPTPPDWVGEVLKTLQ